MNSLSVLFMVVCLIAFSTGHHTLHRKSDVQDKDHLKDHFQGVDLDSLSEEELRFYYFTSHDVEGNGKLDGCELVQALLHFHAEANSSCSSEAKHFSDAELSLLVDHVLHTDDSNFDGFIDYSEFVAGQISQGL